MPPWTVGIEEELMLLDPLTFRLANRVDDVLAALPADLAARSSAETHACVLELNTPPQPTVGAMATGHATLRFRLERALDRLGLCAAVAGTHPGAVWTDVEVCGQERYRHILASMRALAEREPTLALHIHVAVPDPAAAIVALNGLRQDVPLLLAISANSPYWQGRDTGLSSARTPLFGMFPRTGTPRHFDSYEAYVEALDALVRAGAIPEPSFVWWDIRLRPHLGTLEVRVMDAQTRVQDVAALAALVQCLVVMHVEGTRRVEPLAAEALAENRFLAARDGIDAEFVTSHAGRQPVAHQLAELLGLCGPTAKGLRCRDELDAVAELADEPGHARQRAVFRAGGLTATMRRLASDFGLTAYAAAVV